jgi:hypothetical protein
LFRTSLRPTNVPHDLAELASFDDGKTAIVFAHQDDDVLWMLPFWPKAQKFLLAAYPVFSPFQALVHSLPAELHYAQKWEPVWGVQDAKEFASIFTDHCLREHVVHLESIKAHLRPYLREGVKRVVTHNNWGEYGHHQHRLVNQAVRELAVEYKLDVYALGVRVHWQSRDNLLGYENVGDQTGLPQPIQGFFDPQLFHHIRQIYLQHKLEGDTSEITQKLQRWSRTLWTWSQKPFAFPAGWRPFIKLVQAGEDLTLQNEAVRQLTQQPEVNVCPKHLHAL